MSVTAAMFDSGFQTKSNFNREFRRVTSLNPAAWREKEQARVNDPRRRFCRRGIPSTQAG